MKKLLALLLLPLSAFVYAEERCDIITNDSETGFESTDNRMIEGNKGSISVVARDAHSMISITLSNLESNDLVYGTDYYWTIDGQEVERMDEPVLQGFINGIEERTFEIYPVLLKDNLKAGTIESNVNVKIECKNVMRNREN